MNARAAFATDQDIIVALHAPLFCLIAFSLSELDGCWSRSEDLREWEIVTYAVNNFHSALSTAAPDRSRRDSGIRVEEGRTHGTTIQSEPQNVLLLKTPTEVDRPWMIALHAFTPTWRHLRNDTSHPETEITILAYGRTVDHSVNNKLLLVYKVRLYPDLMRASRSIPIPRPALTLESGLELISNVHSSRRSPLGHALHLERRPDAHAGGYRLPARVLALQQLRIRLELETGV